MQNRHGRRAMQSVRRRSDHPVAPRKQESVMICLPTTHEMPAKTAVCLALLMQRSAPAVPHLTIAHCEGGSLARARDQMARDALASGVEWLMWVDSDQTFPPDGMLSLLDTAEQFGYPILGATYRQRQPPDYPYLLPLLAALQPGERFPAVTYLPHGFMLVHRRVYEALKPPFYRMDYGLDPEHPEAFVGEDGYFGVKARAAGFDVRCDLALTQQIGHLLPVEFKWEPIFDTIAGPPLVQPR
jgi:hypothetical protein